MNKNFCYLIRHLIRFRPASYNMGTRFLSDSYLVCNWVDKILWTYYYLIAYCNASGSSTTTELILKLWLSIVHFLFLLNIQFSHTELYLKLTNFITNCLDRAELIRNYYVWNILFTSFQLIHSQLRKQLWEESFTVIKEQIRW